VFLKKFEISATQLKPDLGVTFAPAKNYSFPASRARSLRA
jgi:hypothetical protein